MREQVGHIVGHRVFADLYSCRPAEVKQQKDAIFFDQALRVGHSVCDWIVSVAIISRDIDHAAVNAAIVVDMANDQAHTEILLVYRERVCLGLHPDEDGVSAYSLRQHEEKN